MWKMEKIERKDFLCGVLLILLVWGFFEINLIRAVPAWMQTAQKSYVALVIDDFGNNGKGTKEMLALNIPLTAAVMPSLEYSAHDAELAHAAGKEVIIHMPMESETAPISFLGPNPIFVKLSDEEIVKRLNDGLTELKYAVGINNHMGSKVTANRHAMDVIMQWVKEKNLFFLDSVTTSKSVVGDAAKEIGTKILTRDIFLDNVKSVDAIKKQLERTAKTAKKNGFAIAIGHVGPEGGEITARAIREMAPILEQDRIQFVTLSQLQELVGKREKTKK